VEVEREGNVVSGHKVVNHADGRAIRSTNHLVAGVFPRLDGIVPLTVIQADLLSSPGPMLGIVFVIR
jgi:hypothetical protein